MVDSGVEAIELLKQDKYDVVLLDLYMPELDGYETSNIIRRFNKKVVLIGLTAACSVEVKAHISESSLDDFEIKPFKTNKFINKINDHIQNKRSNL